MNFGNLLNLQSPVCSPRNQVHHQSSVLVNGTAILLIAHTPNLGVVLYSSLPFFLGIQSVSKLLVLLCKYILIPPLLSISAFCPCPHCNHLTPGPLQRPHWSSCFHTLALLQPALLLAGTVILKDTFPGKPFLAKDH